MIVEKFSCGMWPLG